MQTGECYKLVALQMTSEVPLQFTMLVLFFFWPLPKMHLQTFRTKDI